MKNTSRSKRAELLRTIRLAETGKYAALAMRAHRELRIHPPLIEEIAFYRKQKVKDLETVKLLVVQKYIDSVLDVRLQPLITANIPYKLQELQKKIEAALIEYGAPQSEEEVKIFNRIAFALSRSITMYYVEDNRGIVILEGSRLEKILPYLAQHLMTEIRLCLESGFSEAGYILTKNSVFDVYDAIQMAKAHKDEIVRANAPTIIAHAINRRNLKIVKEITEGAQAKLEWLEAHEEEIVRTYARTIMSSALNLGDLGIVNDLANGLVDKLRELENHPCLFVKERATRILHAAINKGKLSHADRLAQEIEAKLKILKEHEDPKVKENAERILGFALRRGWLTTIDVAPGIAKYCATA